MEFKNLETLIKFLKNFFSKTVLNITGKVDVPFPEVQKVEVTNPTQTYSSVAVTNLSDLEKAVSESTSQIVASIEKSNETLSNSIKSIPEHESMDSTIVAIESVRQEIEGLHPMMEKMNEPVTIKAVLKIK